MMCWQLFLVIWNFTTIFMVQHSDVIVTTSLWGIYTWSIWVKLYKDFRGYSWKFNPMISTKYIPGPKVPTTDAFSSSGPHDRSRSKVWMSPFMSVLDNGQEYSYKNPEGNQRGHSAPAPHVADHTRLALRGMQKTTWEPEVLLDIQRTSCHETFMYQLEKQVFSYL